MSFPQIMVPNLMWLISALVLSFAMLAVVSSTGVYYTKYTEKGGISYVELAGLEQPCVEALMSQQHSPKEILEEHVTFYGSTDDIRMIVEVVRISTKSVYCYW